MWARNPDGSRVAALLLLFALLGIIARLAGEWGRRPGALAIFGLYLLVAPLLIGFSPDQLQPQTLAPLIVLAVLFAVIGIERFSGLFGPQAQGVFNAACLTLIVLSSGGLIQRLGQTWVGLRENAPETALIRATCNKAAAPRPGNTAAFGHIGATTFTPALADAKGPTLFFRGLIARTERGLQPLRTPAEWFEYLEAGPQQYLPSVMVSRRNDWPHLDLFGEVLAEWPDRPVQPDRTAAVAEPACWISEPVRPRNPKGSARPGGP